MKTALLFCLVLLISCVVTLEFFVVNNASKDYYVSLYWKAKDNNQFSHKSFIWKSDLVAQGRFTGPYSISNYLEIYGMNPNSGYLTGPVFFYEGDIILFDGIFKWGT